MNKRNILAALTLLGLAGTASAQTFINHTVVQPAQLVADAGADQSNCSGDSVALGGNPSAQGGTAPFTYSWAPSTGLSNPTASNPNAAPGANQAYGLIVTDANGCTSSDQTNVTLGAVSAGFSVNANLLAVAFTNTSTGASSYFWDFGNGATSTFANPSHTYSSAGVYTVCLIADPGTACADTLCQNITVIEVGIRDHEFKNYVTLYPNPSQAGMDLNFHMGDLQVTEAVNIQITDLQGRIVRIYQGAAGNQVYTVSSKDIARGTYHYRVHTAGAVVGEGKFILE